MANVAPGSNNYLLTKLAVTKLNGPLEHILWAFYQTDMLDKSKTFQKQSIERARAGIVWISERNLVVKANYLCKRCKNKTDKLR